MAVKKSNYSDDKTNTWLDMRKMLSEFNRSLTLIVDKDLLLANAISKIKQISPVDKISFFLLRHDTDQFLLADTSQPEEEVPRNTMFNMKSKLVNWLSVNESYLLVSQSPSIVIYFSEQEQAVINTMKAEFIYPLKVMNRLSGLVFIGRKMKGNKFIREELDLLTLLLDQAALAFENALLYEEQSVRIKKMYRADRLAILGQLAAGAAHEIRNPLTAIRSTIQYLGKGMQDPDKAEMINELMEEVDRINKIVQGLLSFAKPSELETAKVDVDKLLQQTFVLINNMIQKQHVNVLYNIQTDDTGIIADPAQLKQVFLNIILNAIEAMTDMPDKELTITIENSQHIDLHSRYIIISFEDKGIGIGKEDVENVFNPFYTTKKDGTGLGLPISYGIVNRHKGEIEVDSQQGSGTKIMIKLPQPLR
ncbi:MAG: GHKL domain-containing protein [Prevotellaceae bacterium]|jgi:signal transduction histidine kinase|nr:GHKL domain-containing protein [Prevotellaceae bacterium]